MTARALTALTGRPWHAGLAALVTGLLLGPLSRATTVAVAAGLLGAALLVGRPRLGTLTAIALLAGGMASCARLAQVDRTQLRTGHAAALRAALVEPPRARPHAGWSAAASVSAGPGRGERLVLRAGRWVQAPRAGVGDVLDLRGTLRPLAPFEAHERVRGAHAALVVRRAALTGRRRGGLRGELDGVRRRAEAGVTAGLPPPQGALARGMVLGQDDALSETVRDDFRASGLSHLLRWCRVAIRGF